MTVEFPDREERARADALDAALDRRPQAQRRAGPRSETDDLADLAASLRAAMPMPDLPSGGRTEVRAAALAVRGAKRRDRAKLLVAAAVTLHVRCTEGSAPPVPVVRQDLRLVSAALVAVTGVMLAAGTVVTGTGPLAGHADTPRYKFPLAGVTQLHADIGWLLCGLTVALVLGLRVSGAPPRAMRAGWIVICALLLQGMIGYIQYFNHLPAGLVWVHVTGAVLVWIAVLRLFFAMRDRGRVNSALTGPAASVPARQPERLDR